MAEPRISRMGFWKRAVVGGLTALMMYTSGGCGAAVSRPALRVEEDYARMPRAVPEMVIEDPLDNAARALEETIEEAKRVEEEIGLFLKYCDRIYALHAKGIPLDKKYKEPCGIK